MASKALLGKRIRMYRKKQLLTLEELAGIVDADYSHIGKVERGQDGISLELLEKIAKALQVDVNELLK